jgi:mannose-6-phosphate isomerase-like protein (cupin superfamily)
MSIQIKNFEQVKTVSKPWGQEKWIQPGEGNHPYVLKEIILNKDFRTSIQVHQFKSETNYILEGIGEIWYSEEFFDCEKYKQGGYSKDDITRFIANLKVEQYASGSVMTIEAGTIHRMVAKTDLRFVESSTPHLDDVVRLQDDANRPDGKIESEHK